ncbi:MAG: SDR family oxidoreductase, partial [Polyangiaceae bacterium]|nr:SDR family oxidoreductase [Polyangiaceae bacterium]
MSEERPVALVTGFPSRYLAMRVVERLTGDDPRMEVRCVVPDEERTRAMEALENLPSQARTRVHLYEGSTSSMDMGLSGPEYCDLVADVSIIHHVGSVAHVSAAKK